MNPASRIYDLLLTLQGAKDKNKSLLEAYKTVLNAEDIYRVYDILHMYQSNLLKIKKEIKLLKKADRYKKLFLDVEKLVLPTNMQVPLSQYDQILTQITPQFMILADSFENPKYHENDVGKELEAFLGELDVFLENVMKTNMDKRTRYIYIVVVGKLKQAILNYKYIGIEAVAKEMAAFECIAKEDKKASAVYKRLLHIVNRAKEVKDAVAFLSESVDDIMEYIRLLG